MAASEQSILKVGSRKNRQADFDMGKIVMTRPLGSKEGQPVNQQQGHGPPRLINEVHGVFDD